MTRCNKQILVTLVILAMTGLGISALADESAAEPEEAEKNSESLKNMLRWTTASEVDNFGFDVYRGDSEDGPFERVTAEPILGAGTTDLPSSYEFADLNIEPGMTYWYYVESISKRGARKRFTPIFRKLPKSASKDADTAADSKDPEDDPNPR